MNGRLPAHRWRSLAPCRPVALSSSRRPSASTLSSSCATVSNENAGGGPAASLFGAVKTTSSTKSSAATNGSSWGGPCLPFSAALPASFSSASTVVTRSSSISFCANSSISGRPPRVALTVTHCTRVNRPWSMPSRTNQRRSEFNAGDGVTRPDDGAWGNPAKRESNRPAMAAAPPAGCRLGGCKPAGMQGAWAFHTEIMLRKFIARLRESFGPDPKKPVQAAPLGAAADRRPDHRSEEHTSELQSLRHLVCRLLLEKKNENALRETLGQANAWNRLALAAERRG